MMRTINNYLAEAKINKKIRLHDLRHSFATTMLLDGAPIERVSRMLGHASINVTIDRYDHYRPAEKDLVFLDRRPKPTLS